ncbi:CAF17-like 4Fe-4S cluster assembly/insertion protein YgfZ [Haematobacter genomosp. 1]|uniref:Folate-binding protein YgfZ n=1 Tax=Haematobacter genomosp. 1 TaxID=366618 RepID=A0A212A8J9_9RHOB|nr:folate-binding protein YgfZ [Haematobacter genomosp. 1]OWJ76265.1 folate-binding protein YgfZ [Haematobacter genomosp. 1]
MTGERASNRKIYEITGADRVSFLQNLVTNDLGRLKDGLVYAALLTPQGKYLADFFLADAGDRILLDADAEQAEALARRLQMYRLRAAVAIAPSPLHVLRGLGEPPEGALRDPRHPALGWRLYTDEEGGPPAVDWDAIRVAETIPEAGVELLPDDTYILEAGFDRLNGVDFRKGCYVGQEVTARMKHKTELRKGFVSVVLDSPVTPGAEVLAEGKPAGRVFTVAGNRAIAYLRFDRAAGPLTADGIALRRT